MEKKNTHIMYGFITGLAMIVVSLIVYLTGMAFKPGARYIAYIPFLAGIIMHAIAFSKTNDGFVTFGNVFGSCFRAAMIITLIMIAWGFISVAIFPDIKPRTLEMIREQMVKQGQLSDEKIEGIIEKTKNNWNLILIGGGLFSNIFWGVIFSLIGGVVAKKKGPAPITSDNF